MTQVVLCIAECTHKRLSSIHYGLCVMLSSASSEACRGSMELFGTTGSVLHADAAQAKA